MKLDVSYKIIKLTETSHKMVLSRVTPKCSANFFPKQRNDLTYIAQKRNNICVT